jgi:hypothetical protein
MTLSIYVQTSFVILSNSIRKLIYIPSVVTSAIIPPCQFLQIFVIYI